MAKAKLILGRKVSAPLEYNPKILTPIERSLSRAGLKMHSFEGYDLWRFYELTYLDLHGIPQVATGTLKVPASSPYLIESKSLKLYLASLTQTKFTGLDELKAVISADLKRKLKIEPEVELTSANAERQPLGDLLLPWQTGGFELIDPLGAGLRPVTTYRYDPDSLFSHHARGSTVAGTVCSQLLHTLCPVTGQPDHASVFISYQGESIDPLLLLEYLISLRQYQGFHEQVCELIYSDLMTYFKLEKLCVVCCFTRRGGIDINPLRCSGGYRFNIPRTFRQ